MFATEFAFQKNVGNQTSATQFLEWHKGVIAIFLMKKKMMPIFPVKKKSIFHFQRNIFQHQLHMVYNHLWCHVSCSLCLCDTEKFWASKIPTQSIPAIHGFTYAKSGGNKNERRCKWWKKSIAPANTRKHVIVIASPRQARKRTRFCDTIECGAHTRNKRYFPIINLK